MKKHNAPENLCPASRNKAFREFRQVHFPFPLLCDIFLLSSTVDQITSKCALPWHLISLSSDMNNTLDAVRDLRQCSGQLAWLQGVADYGLQTPAGRMGVDECAIAQAPARQRLVRKVRRIYEQEVVPCATFTALEQLQLYYADWNDYQHRYNLFLYRAGYLLASHATAPGIPLSPDVASCLLNMLHTAVSNPRIHSRLMDASQYDYLSYWYGDIALYKSHSFDDCTPKGELLCTFDDLATERIFDRGGHQAWLQGVVACVCHAPAAELRVDEKAIRQSESYEAGAEAVHQIYSNHIFSECTARDLQELHAFYEDWPDYLHKNNLILYVAGYLTALTITDPDAVLPEDVENRLADMYAQATREETHTKEQPYCRSAQYAKRRGLPHNNILCHIYAHHFRTAKEINGIWYISKNERHPTLPRGHVTIAAYAAHTGRTKAEIMGYLAGEAFQTQRYDFSGYYISLYEPCPDTPPKYIPAQEYAQLHGLSVDTVRQRAQSGFFQSPRWFTGNHYSLFLPRDAPYPITSDMLSLKEYGQMYGLSSKWLLDLIHKGQLPGARKLGKQWYIPKDTLFKD